MRRGSNWKYSRLLKRNTPARTKMQTRANYWVDLKKKNIRLGLIKHQRKRKGLDANFPFTTANARILSVRAGSGRAWSARHRFRAIKGCSNDVVRDLL